MGEMGAVGGLDLAEPLAQRNVDEGIACTQRSAELAWRRVGRRLAVVFAQPGFKGTAD